MESEDCVWNARERMSNSQGDVFIRSHRRIINTDWCVMHLASGRFACTTHATCPAEAGDVGILRLSFELTAQDAQRFACEDNELRALVPIIYDVDSELTKHQSV